MGYLHGCGVEKLICLGDLVSYAAEPRECIDLLANHPLYSPEASVAGNHEWGLLGLDPEFQFSRDAWETIVWSRSVIHPGDTYWQFLAGLPGTGPQNVTWDGWPLAFVHGSTDNPRWGSLDNTGAADLATRSLNFRVYLAGHTHIPIALQRISEDDPRSKAAVRKWEKLELYFLPSTSDASGIETRTLDLKAQSVIINPGSVGQPRDGDSRAACGLLDTSNSQVSFLRLPYDKGPTLEAFKRFNNMLAPEQIKRLARRLMDGR